MTMDPRFAILFEPVKIESSPAAPFFARRFSRGRAHPAHTTSTPAPASVAHAGPSPTRAYSVAPLGIFTSATSTPSRSAAPGAPSTPHAVTLPVASITAHIPVLAARSVGVPSSRLRQRAAWRCCSRARRLPPNHPSLVTFTIRSARRSPP
mgnify:CR=1 FL=1